MQTTVTSSAIDHEATLVVLTRGKMLADYSNMERIGKMPSRTSTASDSRSRFFGANSVVTKATLDGCDGELALKALIPFGAVDETNALKESFDSELEIGDATKVGFRPRPTSCGRSAPSSTT